MQEAPDARQGLTPDAAAIAAAHAVYTPAMLRVYDTLVHGLSNRFAWRCSTERLLGLYRDNLSRCHLEAGVGTGFFIDRADPSRFDYLALLDINDNCLARSAERLRRYRPVVRQADLFSGVPAGLETVDSIGLTYVLHCLPGRLPEKLGVVDSLRPLLRERGVLFGATILGRGIAPNAAARGLLGFYNAKGVFNNHDDDLAALEAGLKTRFDRIDIETEGCVALFRAR